MHAALGPVGVAGSCLSWLVGADGFRSDQPRLQRRVAVCCSSKDWLGSGRQLQHD